MDVSGIVTRLAAQCPTLEQVLQASTGGTQSPVDTQAALYALLSPLVGARMYPLQAPEGVAQPSMVYQMVSSAPGVFEGYDVTHTDLYVVNLRGPDYDALVDLMASVVSALDGQTIEITDILHDYHEGEDLYRINLELTYTYITASAQDLPAAFVYPLTQSAGESVYDNRVKQAVQAEYAVLVLTDAGNMPALLGEIRDALLGWQQTEYHHEMEYSNGSAIEGVGGLELWRETYRDTFYFEQP